MPLWCRQPTRVAVAQCCGPSQGRVTKLNKIVDVRQHIRLRVDWSYLLNPWLAPEGLCG